MKFLIYIISFFVISFNSHAARTWANISIEDSVFLAKDLQIVNSELSFNRSARLKITEISLMEMINVYLFKAKAETCSLPEATSELELYYVSQSSGKTTIGIELLKNCILEIYVEKKDFRTTSLFN